MQNRLKFYLEEAAYHINRLNEVKETLEENYPLSEEQLSDLSVEIKDKLDVLAFRFAKLQDLLGTKIFRSYLSHLKYPIEDKNYLELLRELEKEGVLNIDKWSEFRSIRNALAHDYPGEEEERARAINFLIENIDELIKIVKKIEQNYEA